MKEPTPFDAARFVMLRIQGKSGGHLSEQDLCWLRAFYEEYSEWWEANRDRINRKVYSATKPW